MQFRSSTAISINKGENKDKDKDNDMKKTVASLGSLITLILGLFVSPSVVRPGRK